jgi:hypothetical protein
MSSFGLWLARAAHERVGYEGGVSALMTETLSSAER